MINLQKKSWQQLLSNHEEDLTIGISLLDEKGETLFNYHAKEIFPAASTIKLGIALYIAENESQQGLSTMLQLSKRVPGAGVLYLLNQKTAWTISELLQLMVMVSDNTAANTLMDHYGMETIQSWLKKKYPSANLQRYFMDLNATNQNHLSAQDAAQMMVDIFKEPTDFSKKKSYALIRTALAHQQFCEGLLASITEKDIPHLKTFSKNGTLNGIYHDVCRIAYQKKTITLAVFTQQKEKDNVQQEKALSHCQLGQNFLQQVGSMVMEEVLS